jgi:hypothetical protein
MYHMMRSLGVKDTLRRELPAAAVAFLIAEVFYKFHSFALETLAFLATWWVLSWAENRLSAALRRRDADHAR